MDVHLCKNSKNRRHNTLTDWLTTLRVRTRLLISETVQNPMERDTQGSVRIRDGSFTPTKYVSVLQKPSMEVTYNCT